MKPGIYHGLTRSEYAAIPAFNQSTLKKWIEIGVVQQNPAKFKHWLDTKSDADATDAQIEGQVVDCLVLEPDQFTARFAIPHDAPKRPTSAQLKAKKPSDETIAAIAWWEEFNATFANHTIIDAFTYRKCKAMADALLSRRDLAKILETCRKTVIVAEMHGHLCKAELDLFGPETDFIFDIKKTRSAANTDRCFGRDAFTYRYDIQTAFYLDIATAAGHPRSKFAFYLVEDEQPYFTNVACLESRDEMVASARIQYKAAIDGLSHHMKSGEWPGYPPYQPIQFPIWAQMEAEQITG